MNLVVMGSLFPMILHAQIIFLVIVTMSDKENNFMSKKHIENNLLIGKWIFIYSTRNFKEINRISYPSVGDVFSSSGDISRLLRLRLDNICLPLLLSPYR